MSVPVNPGFLDKLRLLLHGSSYPDLANQIASRGPAFRFGVGGVRTLHGVSLPLILAHTGARYAIPPLARGEDALLDKTLDLFRTTPKEAAWTQALSFLDRPGRLVYGWKPSQLVGHGAAAGGALALGIPAGRTAWNALHDPPPPETPAPGPFDPAGEAISSHPYAAGAAALGTAGLLAALLSRRKKTRPKSATFSPAPMNPFLTALRRTRLTKSASAWGQVGRTGAAVTSYGAIPAYLGHHYMAKPDETSPWLKGTAAGTTAGATTGALVGALAPAAVRAQKGGISRVGAGLRGLAGGGILGLLSSLIGGAATKRVSSKPPAPGKLPVQPAAPRAPAPAPAPVVKASSCSPTPMNPFLTTLSQLTKSAHPTRTGIGTSVYNFNDPRRAQVQQYWASRAKKPAAPVAAAPPPPAPAAAIPPPPPMPPAAPARPSPAATTPDGLTRFDREPINFQALDDAANSPVPGSVPTPTPKPPPPGPALLRRPAPSRGSQQFNSRFFTNMGAYAPGH